MSHNIITQTQPFGAPTFVQFTIVDYNLGGETINVSEFNAKTIKDFLCFETFSSLLGQLVFPDWTPLNPFSGRIKIFQVSAGALVEIPTTVGLNLQISGYAQIT